MAVELSSRKRNSKNKRKDSEEDSTHSSTSRHDIKEKRLSDINGQFKRNIRETNYSSKPSTLACLAFFGLSLVLILSVGLILVELHLKQRGLTELLHTYIEGGVIEPISIKNIEKVKSKSENRPSVKEMPSLSKDSKKVPDSSKKEDDLIKINEEASSVEEPSTKKKKNDSMYPMKVNNSIHSNDESIPKNLVVDELSTNKLDLSDVRLQEMERQIISDESLDNAATKNDKNDKTSKDWNKNNAKISSNVKDKDMNLKVLLQTKKDKEKSQTKLLDLYNAVEKLTEEVLAQDPENDMVRELAPHLEGVIRDINSDKLSGIEESLLHIKEILLDLKIRLQEAKDLKVTNQKENDKDPSQSTAHSNDKNLYHDKIPVVEIIPDPVYIAPRGEESQDKNLYDDKIPVVEVNPDLVNYAQGGDQSQNKNLYDDKLPVVDVIPDPVYIAPKGDQSQDKNLDDDDKHPVVEVTPDPVNIALRGDQSQDKNLYDDKISVVDGAPRGDKSRDKILNDDKIPVVEVIPNPVYISPRSDQSIAAEGSTVQTIQDESFIPHLPVQNSESIGHVEESKPKTVSVLINTRSNQEADEVVQLEKNESVPEKSSITSTQEENAGKITVEENVPMHNSEQKKQRVDIASPEIKVTAADTLKLNLMDADISKQVRKEGIIIPEEEHIQKEENKIHKGDKHVEPHIEETMKLQNTEKIISLVEPAIEKQNLKVNESIDKNIIVPEIDMENFLTTASKRDSDIKLESANNVDDLADKFQEKVESIKIMNQHENKNDSLSEIVSKHEVLNEKAIVDNGEKHKFLIIGNENTDPAEKTKELGINVDKVEIATSPETLVGKTGHKPVAQENDENLEKPILQESLKGNQPNEKLNDQFLKAEEEELILKNPAAALNMFTRSLLLNPKEVRALLGKAKALDKLAEKESSNTLLEKAIVAYFDIINLAEEDTELINKGMLRDTVETCIEKLNFRGWRQKVAPLLIKVMKHFPNDLRLQNQLGRAYLMTNENAQASKTFLQILQNWPNDGFAQVHYGFVLKITNKNLTEAVKYLHKGIQSGEEGTVDGRFYLHLGDAYQRLGENEKAYKVYDGAVSKGLFLNRYQRSLHNIDRLKAKPIWTLQETTYEVFFRKLSANWEKIMAEGLSILDLDPSLGFKPESELLRKSGEWNQFELFSRGSKNKAHCARVPVTCSLIEDFLPAAKNKRGQTKFSLLLPGTTVYKHTGPTNCRLRAHLGLITPPGAALKVVNDTLTWEAGKIFVFDDSFEHEVWHTGDSMRLILIVDVWHPEITEAERLTLTPI